jgi:hypothetical protein
MLEATIFTSSGVGVTIAFGSTRYFTAIQNVGRAERVAKPRRVGSRRRPADSVAPKTPGRRVVRPTGGTTESVEEDGPGRPPARERGRAEPRSGASGGKTLEGQSQEARRGVLQGRRRAANGERSLEGDVGPRPWSAVRGTSGRQGPGNRHPSVRGRSFEGNSPRGPGGNPGTRRPRTHSATPPDPDDGPRIRRDDDREWSAFRPDRARSPRSAALDGRGGASETKVRRAIAGRRSLRGDCSVQTRVTSPGPGDGNHGERPWNDQREPCVRPGSNSRTPPPNSPSGDSRPGGRRRGLLRQPVSRRARADPGADEPVLEKSGPSFPPTNPGRPVSVRRGVRRDRTTCRSRESI